MPFVRECDENERVRLAALIRAGRNSSDPHGYHAMLFSYFDDSSDERRQKYFACGGLIGGEAQWLTFDALWANATRDLIEPFRSTECECNQKQFKEWPKSRCNALMDALVGLLQNYMLSAFASIVPIADYKDVFPDCKKYDPYYLAVRHTILNMAHIGWAGRHHVKLWFEDNPATSPMTLKIYNEVKSVKNWDPATYLLGITFGSKSLYPLQAADLVAREAFKHVDNLGTRSTRIPMKRLGNRAAFALWRKEALVHLRDNGGPENIELLTSWEQTEPPPIPYFYKNF